jgi:hypothetical protein
MRVDNHMNGDLLSVQIVKVAVFVSEALVLRRKQYWVFYNDKRNVIIKTAKLVWRVCLLSSLI